MTKDDEAPIPMVAAIPLDSRNEPEIYVGGVPSAPPEALDSNHSPIPGNYNWAPSPPFSPNCSAPTKYPSTTSGNNCAPNSSVFHPAATAPLESANYPSMANGNCYVPNSAFHSTPESANVTTSGAATNTSPPQNGPSVVPVGMIGSLGRTPKRMKCRYCGQETATRTSYRIDWVTVLAVLLMLLIFWPLFWLPLVFPCCYATVHSCPNCRQQIGRTNPCSE